MAQVDVRVQQGYRIWRMRAARNALSHPALLILPLTEPLLVLAFARFRAILRRTARLRGALSVRARDRSSSNTTSMTQCSWFRCPNGSERWPAARRLLRDVTGRTGDGVW